MQSFSTNRKVRIGMVQLLHIFKFLQKSWTIASKGSPRTNRTFTLLPILPASSLSSTFHKFTYYTHDVPERFHSSQTSFHIPSSRPFNPPRLLNAQHGPYTGLDNQRPVSLGRQVSTSILSHHYNIMNSNNLQDKSPAVVSTVDSSWKVQGPPLIICIPLYSTIWL